MRSWSGGEWAGVELVVGFGIKFFGKEDCSVGVYPKCSAQACVRSNDAHREACVVRGVGHFAEEVIARDDTEFVIPVDCSGEIEGIDQCEVGAVLAFARHDLGSREKVVSEEDEVGVASNDDGVAGSASLSEFKNFR